MSDPSNPSSNTTILLVQCHCRTFTQNLHLPASSLPLKSSICQCNSCRHTTGQLLSTFTVIPGPLPDASFFTSLAKYNSSESFERWFCPVCGASVLNVERGQGRDKAGVVEWEFATGVLEFAEQGDGKGMLDGRLRRALMWVADCRDGGAVGWVNDGKAGPGLDGGRFVEGRGTASIADTAVGEIMAKGREVVREKGDVLKGHCHCKAVQFEIHEPAAGAEAEDCSAELCCCSSCRKTSGVEVTSWTHIAKDRITTAGAEPYTYLLQGLAHYESSKGTHRYFCKTCGATVAYDRADLKRLDLALGLMDAGDGGARLEQWFAWNPDEDDVGFMDDAVDKMFVGKLADGVGKWTRKAGEMRRVAEP